VACAAVLVVATLSGCAREAGRRYALRGRVVSVEADVSRVNVAHDDIPGFMPAMTMAFKIRPPGALAEVRPGDRIEATLVVTEAESWLEQIRVVAQESVPQAPAAGTSGDAATGDAEPPAREAHPGDPVPDVALLNQDGRSIRIRDYRGRALAITFIFTRCPLPEFCPRMSSRFAEVARALAGEPRLQSRTHLLSVSFDPAFDTPAVLQEYGARWAPHGFAHWEFASGEEAEVRRLARGLGVFYEQDGEGGFVHNLRTVVVDPEGGVSRVLVGNEWSADDLVAALRAAAG